MHGGGDELDARFCGILGPVSGKDHIFLPLSRPCYEHLISQCNVDKCLQFPLPSKRTFPLLSPIKSSDSLNYLLVFQPFVEKHVSMTHLDLLLGSPYIELETCLSLLVIYCQNANISRKGNLHAIYEIIRHIFEGTIIDPQHCLTVPFILNTYILYIVVILTLSVCSFSFLKGQCVNKLYLALNTYLV